MANVHQEGSEKENTKKEHTKLLWSVERLLRLPQSEHEWIIEGMLRKDSQMLLAAPPKSGKSLLASEIALALALPFHGKDRFLFQAEPHEESKFPGLRIKPPENKDFYKVLFFSLEMRETEVAKRLQCQLGGFQIHAKRLAETDKLPGELDFPLVNIFGLERGEPKKNSDEIQSDLEIVSVVAGEDRMTQEVKPGKHADRLRQIITEELPDVVIFDTLIQLHGVNENDNILMKGVMRALRLISVIQADPKKNRMMDEPIAHIVLHHTRKEGGNFRAPLSPEIMRGAGAVHGVADLVMLARKTYRDDELEIHISSRSSSIPNFKVRRCDKTLTFRWLKPADEAEKLGTEETKLKVFQQLVFQQIAGAVKPGRKLDMTKLRADLGAAATKLGKKQIVAGDETLAKRMNDLIQAGLIGVTRAGQRTKSLILGDDHFWVIETPESASDDEGPADALG